MTSLDFKALLKQEKIRHLAELSVERDTAAESRSTRDAGNQAPKHGNLRRASFNGAGDITTVNSTNESSSSLREVVNGPILDMVNFKEVFKCSSTTYRLFYEDEGGSHGDVETIVPSHYVKTIRIVIHTILSGFVTPSAFIRLALPSLLVASCCTCTVTQIRLPATRSIFYAPGFVSESQAQHILSRLYDTESGKGGIVHAGDSAWLALKSRRLQSWGGQPGEDFRQDPLPVWMENLCDALVARGAFPSEGRPNHVLINEYMPGQGIMPHTDGPCYEPRTATLSLGGDAIMHFSPRVAAEDIGRAGVDTRVRESVVLRERCLVIFAEEAYSRMLHGIDAVAAETVGAKGAAVANGIVADAPDGTLIRRRLRVSLTFRRTAKVPCKASVS